MRKNDHSATDRDARRHHRRADLPLSLPAQAEPRHQIALDLEVTMNAPNRQMGWWVEKMIEMYLKDTKDWKGVVRSYKVKPLRSGRK